MKLGTSRANCLVHLNLGDRLSLLGFCFGIQRFFFAKIMRSNIGVFGCKKKLRRGKKTTPQIYSISSFLSHIWV